MPAVVKSVGTHFEKCNMGFEFHKSPYFENLNLMESTTYRGKKRSETAGTLLRYHGLAVGSRVHGFTPGGLSRNDMMACFRLNADAGALFPFLNAVTERAELHETPQFIRFLYENRFCVLYPRAGLITPVEDRPQAVSFLERLISFLNDIASRHNEIIPNHRLHRRVSVLNILKLLPKTNCGLCGYASCMAFAASLSLQESIPEKCPRMGPPLSEQATYPVYDTEGNLVSKVVLNINTARSNFGPNGTHGLSTPGPTDRLKNGARKTEANNSLSMALSARELEVLCILAKGVSNNEISRMLCISPHTVKSHVIHIFNKLGVNDRTQAAVWAARHHLI